ncbi:helix-turn-helix domain-containing protein [Marinomonas sp. TW1]|uniref:helix-turn-helix domain-containing protein n=1 Tax=Marinomonas sp. TW1 TaxID=1561203 RepID=UPI0007AFDFC6|nr:AraC family transcriptional regulator [Marinomonas sp. TW1]KZN13321.1 DNA-binding protein [Marinomonas sp. TW1]
MRDPIELLSYQGTAEAHLHTHTQIVLPLSGQLELEVEGQQQAVEFGQGCLISSQQAHTHLAEHDNRCLVLNALPIWNQDLISQEKFIQLTPQAQAYLPFLSTLSADSNLLKQQQALVFLEHLLPLPKETLRHAHVRLQKAKQLIDQEFANGLSIKQVAQQVHLSTSQLTLLFKQHLSVTPKQYLLQKQFTAAKHWLSCSQHSLEEIAQKVGLSNASALVRLFHQHGNMTPGTFRSTLHAESQKQFPSCE